MELYKLRLESFVTTEDKKRIEKFLTEAAKYPRFGDWDTRQIKRILVDTMNDAGRLEILNRPLRTWRFSAPHLETFNSTKEEAKAAYDYWQKRPNFMFYKAPHWVYLVCEIFGVDFANCWTHWPDFLKPLQKFIMVKWVKVDWDSTAEHDGEYDTWKGE